MALEDRVRRGDSRVARVSKRIVQSFRTGDVPKALAQRYLQGYEYPARSYSIRNQMLLNLQGDPDARGYRAWSGVNRHVLKGHKARYILAPRHGRAQVTIDDETGRETTRRPLIGWHYLPVFGYDQTAGDPLPEREHAEVRATEHLQRLPLRDVAESWGINVGHSYEARKRGAAAWYSPKRKQITLGVENLATWAHELVHAADDRAGNLDLTDPESRNRAEVVAELGGAVLLTTLGQQKEADLGGCWQYLQRYGGTNPLATIDRLLDRTTTAVDLILQTAGHRPLTAQTPTDNGR